MFPGIMGWWKSIGVVFVDTKKSNKYNNNPFYFMKDELLGATYLIIITLLAGFILACVVGTAIDYTTPKHPVVVQIVETPTLQPTTTTTPYYNNPPEFITYTVRSTDPANLKVVTTNGDFLYFKSRGAWSQQVKRCTYTASVESSNGYSYVIRGYPELEEMYIPTGEGRGEYVEV